MPPFWLLFFLLHSVALSAQNNRKINGTVIDESGEAIIGATVIASDSKHSTITNINGLFELTVPSTTKFLEISFLGYNKVKLQ